MKKALVIGIDEYAGTTHLKGCVNDAGAVANTIETNSDGSPNFAVKLMTSSDGEIMRVNVMKAVEELFSGTCEIALFYFSGHGIVNSSGGYIVTYDSSTHDPGISLDYILGLANNSKIENRIVILDSCHSGSFGTTAIDDGKITHLSEGVTVLTSSHGDEKSKEGIGSGVFTNLLVDALKGGAADLRGYITPGSIYSYIDQALGPWDQRPVFKTNITRFISLRDIDPPVPLSTLREIISIFESPQDQIKLDSTFEFTQEDAIEENVKIFKILQKFAGVGLVVPVGEEYMYFAAINSKSCRLTALGYQYWRLVKEKRI